MNQASTPDVPETLVTRKGALPLPLYLPTLGLGRFVLDKYVLPYLRPEIVPGIMLSQRYIEYLEEPIPQSLWLDCGAYALLSVPQATWTLDQEGLGQIHLPPADCTHAGCNLLHPKSVLQSQEAIAEVGFTLDIPIPPGASAREAGNRLETSVRNADWALRNRRRRDLCLFASVPFHSLKQVRETAQTFTQMRYRGQRFDGLALGGLVPQLDNPDQLSAIVQTVRAVADGLPIHLFGVGEPELVHQLFRLGATSSDSAAFLCRATRGQRWGSDRALVNPTIYEKAHLALLNLAEGQQSTLPFSPFLVNLATWYLRQPQKGQSEVPDSEAGEQP